MHEQLRHQMWIATAAVVVLFTNLGAPRLWDEDEPKNASCAREMLARGDLVTPTFNCELRTDKPVLLYWLMMSAYGVFGVTEFAARFWSATLGVGTCLCVYHLGRHLFRPAVGLWAGVILASTLMFDVAGRAATPDSLLIFFFTLSLLAYVKFCFQRESDGSLSHAQGSWLRFVPAYAAMGLAVLAKGPIGVLLPVAIIGLFLLIVSNRQPGEASDIAGRKSRWSTAQRKLAIFWRATLAMRPLTLLLVVAAIAAPWYILVGIETNGAWLQGFLGKHNLNRFQRPMEGHCGPIYYYIPAIMCGFFPWSVFLPLSLLAMVRRIRGGHEWRQPYVFLACWIGVIVGLFSLAGTKLPSYVTPAYPAIALVMACFLEPWLRDVREISRGWMRAAYGSAAAVGIAMLVALPWAAQKYAPGEAALGLVGAILIVGSGAAVWFSDRLQPQRSLMAYAITAVLFTTALFGVASARVSRHQNTAGLVATAQNASDRAEQLATYRYSPPSVVFYARGRVERCNELAEVERFFATAEDPYLIVEDERLAELKTVLPAGVTVLERQRRFLKEDGEVLLLGRAVETAHAAGHRRL